MSLRCRLGLHKWETYRYSEEERRARRDKWAELTMVGLGPGPSLYWKSTCTRCGKVIGDGAGEPAEAAQVSFAMRDYPDLYVR